MGLSNFFYLSFFSFCLTLFSLNADFPISEQNPQNISIDIELFNALKSMCEEDQEIRKKWIRDGIENDPEYLNLKAIDYEHIQKLKNIVERYGWPGHQLVGEEGAEAMWLLAQHADQDIEFQKKCLALLEAAVAEGDAPKRHLAYLADRVLVNEGQEQIYGTQAIIEKEEIIPHPIKDRNNLDKRREEMGLEPFSEYLSLLRKIYLGK